MMIINYNLFLYNLIQIIVFFLVFYILSQFKIYERHNIVLEWKTK